MGFIFLKLQKSVQDHQVITGRPNQPFKVLGVEFTMKLDWTQQKGQQKQK